MDTSQPYIIPVLHSLGAITGDQLWAIAGASTNAEGNANLLIPEWEKTKAAAVTVSPPAGRNLATKTVEVGGLTEDTSILVRYGTFAEVESHGTSSGTVQIKLGATGAEASELSR